MKSLSASLLIALFSMQEIIVMGASQSCLNCLNQDSNAGFMFSFSYCKKTDVCVADEWNKLNAWCEDGWTQGYSLSVTDDCAGIATAEPIKF